MHVLYHGQWLTFNFEDKVGLHRAWGLGIKGMSGVPEKGPESILELSMVKLRLVVEFELTWPLSSHSHPAESWGCRSTAKQ